MLTPSYLLHAVEPAEEIAEQLHQDILNRIIERILIRFERGDDYILTATDKWNIKLLQEAGYLLEDIQKELATAAGKMQTEIAEAMEDAGVHALEYDDKIYRAAGLDPVPLVQSPKLIAIMQRDYEATLGEWTNFTRTTAIAAQQTFINACDKAYHQAILGVISPAQAVKEALEEVIKDGVIVRYPSGHTDTIETATTRAVRTGISKASGSVQTARMDEFDIDLVLVSSHLGARPEHAVWQGKIYSRSGASEEYPDFVAFTGYGSVTGLCGANCRHNFGPWFEGMENPFEQYDSEENQKQYELEQRQRTLERRIRNTKREVQNWDTARQAAQGSFKDLIEKDYQRKAALLQKQNEAYNKFCEENGLTRRSDRISIAKWDRKQAARARAAAKKWKEYQYSRKYRKKNNQNGFYTMDNRPKGMDIIKPKNVINEMRKSDIGTELYNFMQENEIDVNLWYGIDVPKERMGVFEDGIIHVYAENTKTVLDTTLTVIHEATHAKINRPNSKNQELECFKNEKRHQGIELTDSIIQDIMKEIDDLYPYLEWE